MSEASRREKLEAMLAEQPDDTFLQYALAMELQKEGNHETSLARFRQLMAADPPYVPAFFMSAKQWIALGRIDEARAALREGIEQARRQGDQHAAAEMGELLAAMGKGQPPGTDQP
jgi:thioredoxin-like negative regulator of GroEL